MPRTGSNTYLNPKRMSHKADLVEASKANDIAMEVSSIHKRQLEYRGKGKEIQVRVKLVPRSEMVPARAFCIRLLQNLKTIRIRIRRRVMPEYREPGKLGVAHRKSGIKTWICEV